VPDRSLPFSRRENLPHVCISRVGYAEDETGNENHGSERTCLDQRVYSIRAPCSMLWKPENFETEAVLLVGLRLVSIPSSSNRQRPSRGGECHPPAITSRLAAYDALYFVDGRTTRPKTIAETTHTPSPDHARRTRSHPFD